MDLPGIAQEVADVIGRRLALQLIAAAPRYKSAASSSTHAQFYVPRDCIAPDHPIALAVGPEAAELLRQEFGGLILELPLCVAAVYLPYRNKVIADLAGGGMSRRGIADLLGLCQRTVSRVLRDMPPEAAAAGNDNNPRTSKFLREYSK